MSGGRKESQELAPNLLKLCQGCSLISATDAGIYKRCLV